MAKIKILVVDDSALDRRLAGALLTKAGYVVEHAEDGRAALASVAAKEPDAVVTDLQMPFLDGLELVAQLRVTNPSLPVVLMTAHGSEAVAEAALRIGASSYVPKRKLASDLVETVGAILALLHGGRRESGLDPLEVGELDFELGLELESMSEVIGTLESNLLKLGLCDEGGALQVGVALREAIVNAVVHGSLEVSSSLLDEGDGSSFHALVAKRRKEPPYSRRTVRLRASHTKDEVVYTVTDEGPGFDASTLADPTDVANLDRTHGRGLMLIRTFMDEVSFRGRGNEIRMSKRRARESQA